MLSSGVSATANLGMGGKACVSLCWLACCVLRAAVRTAAEREGEEYAPADLFVIVAALVVAPVGGAAASSLRV